MFCRMINKIFKKFFSKFNLHHFTMNDIIASACSDPNRCILENYGTINSSRTN